MRCGLISKLGLNTTFVISHADLIISFNSQKKYLMNAGILIPISSFIFAKSHPARTDATAPYIRNLPSNLPERNTQIENKSTDATIQVRFFIEFLLIYTKILQYQLFFKKFVNINIKFV